MLRNVVCVLSGAGIGALLRWALALAFNSSVPLIPMGTLIANLSGGYLMGLTLGALAFFPQIPLEARLFIITGFLGTLTTFSAFSGEVILLLQERHFNAAALLVTLHVAGSLLMTALGVASFTLAVRFF